MLRLAGFLVLILSVFGGFTMANGKLMALWQPAEIVIIVGAAVGAFMVANPSSVQKLVATHLHYVIVKQAGFEKDFFMELLQLEYQLFDLLRTKGAAGIEDHIENPENSEIFTAFPRIIAHKRLLHFITDNFRITGMTNITPHELEGLLEQEIHTLEADLKRPGDALQSIADACPGFGIVAAVMGIVITMQSMDGPIGEIGAHVAAALVGTFLGILLCYGIVGPLASAVSYTAQNECLAFDCVKSAMVSCQLGRPPILAVDAGRRVLYDELRPTFLELERWLRGSRE